MSMSLPAHWSMSSARAMPDDNPTSPIARMSDPAGAQTLPSDSSTTFTVPCFIPPALSLRRRDGRRTALAGPSDVDAEIDGRLVRQLRREVALLVPDDGDRRRLGLGRDERLARLGRELVPLEVAEHAEAVALVQQHYGQRGRAGLDRAVVDLEVPHLGETTGILALRTDLNSVMIVGRLYS